MPIDPDPWNGWIVLILGLIALGTALWRFWHKAWRRREAFHAQHQQELREFILEVTRPVQPGYKNGGESMADQSEMLKTLLWNQEQIRSDFTRHIAYHLESKIEGNGQ